MEPFLEWSRLEETYHFVAENCPEFFARNYGEAREEMGRCRRQVSEAAGNTPDKEDQNTWGGDRSSAKVALETHEERAEKNRISHYTQRKLDRLARDFPEIHQRVVAGELSADRAAKLAGFVKEPHGLGYSPDAIDRIMDERQSLDPATRAECFTEDSLREQGRPRKDEEGNPDVIRVSDRGYGTSTDYLTARIAKQHPEVHERMKAGEFPSVRAAARARSVPYRLKTCHGCQQLRDGRPAGERRPCRVGLCDLVAGDGDRRIEAVPRLLHHVVGSRVGLA